MTQKIYALIDTDNSRPFYIGKTNNPQRRLSEHICESKRRAGKAILKEAYIRNAITAGLKVEMVILEDVTKNEVDIAERFWIKNFQHLGLTNVIDNVLPAMYEA